MRLPFRVRVFVAAALAGVLCVGAAGAEEVYGDVNGDGHVNAQDVQLVINAALGISIDPYTSDDADLTGDGAVTAVDIQIVINIALGIGVDLPDNGEVDMDPPLEERMALMDEAEEHFASLDVRELGVDEKNQQMVQWLEEHEAFPGAGVSADEIVYAFFADGTPLLFMDNFLTGEEGDKRGAGEGGKRQADPSRTETAVRVPAKDNDTPPALQPPHPDTLGTERPESRKAEVLNVFHGDVPIVEAMEEIRARLEATGYEMGPLTTAALSPSIRRYMEMDDVGVLVMAGHGGKQTVDEAGDEEPLAYIQTNALASEAEIAELHETEVTAKRIAPMIASVGVQDGVVDYGRRWAISNLFIEEYFDFAPKAVVFTAACNSFNETFIQAFLKKGAGAFLGWDHTIEGNSQAAPRAVHFFNRVLGAEEPTADWDMAPVRAFDFTATLREMDRQDLGAITEGTNQGSTLRVYKAEDEWPSILAPSIRNIRIDPIAGELYLYGLFGAEPESLNDQETHVMVDWEPLTIIEWDAWKITCELPNSGPGSKGPVWLTVNGVFSNIVNLTEYTGTAVMQDGSADFRFRMPVQPFHAKPDWAPSVFLNLMDIGPALTQSPEVVRLLARYGELDSVLHVPIPSPTKAIDFEHPKPIVGYFEEDSTITVHGVGLPPQMDRLPDPDEAFLSAFLDAIVEPPVALGGAWAYPIDDEHNLGMQMGMGGAIETSNDVESAGGSVPPWDAMMNMNNYTVPGGTWHSNGEWVLTWSTLTPEFPPDF